MKTVCECCAEHKECFEHRGLYLCKDCIWEFLNEIEARLRDGEDNQS